MYNSRLNNIKLIDPRGLNEKGEKTIFGDLEREVAKLGHSIVGLYDLIIANNIVVHMRLIKSSINIDLDIYSDERQHEIINKFKEFSFFNSINYSKQSLYSCFIISFYASTLQ